MKPPQKGVYFELYIKWFVIVFNEPVIVQYTMMLESVFEIVQTNKLSLYYELVNIYKYGQKSSFKFFLVFLKIGVF